MQDYIDHRTGSLVNGTREFTFLTPNFRVTPLNSAWNPAETGPHSLAVKSKTLPRKEPPEPLSRSFQGPSKDVSCTRSNLGWNQRRKAQGHDWSVILHHRHEGRRAIISAMG